MRSNSKLFSIRWNQNSMKNDFFFCSGITVDVKTGYMSATGVTDLDKIRNANIKASYLAIYMVLLTLLAKFELPYKEPELKSIFNASDRGFLPMLTQERCEYA